MLDFCYFFVSVMVRDFVMFDVGCYDLYGYIGYGWVMYCDIFDCVGFYECVIFGSVDYFMVYVIFNDCNFCICNVFKYELC